MNNTLYTKLKSPLSVERKTVAIILNKIAFGLNIFILALFLYNTIIMHTDPTNEHFRLLNDFRYTYQDGFIAYLPEVAMWLFIGFILACVIVGKRPVQLVSLICYPSQIVSQIVRENLDVKYWRFDHPNYWRLPLRIIPIILYIGSAVLIFMSIRKLQKDG